MMHDGTGRTSSKGCIGKQSSLVKEEDEEESSSIAESKSIIVVTGVRGIPVLCSVHQTGYCLVHRVLIIVLLFTEQGEGMDLGF